MRWSARQRNSCKSLTAISALAILDADAASAKILLEIHRARGRLMSAAIALGSNRRTLERLVFQLDLWPQIEACRARWSERRRDPLGLKGTAHVS